MTTNNDCPLVIIRWQDSGQPLPSWQHLSELPRTRPIECATVGWLLKDDADVKVVCQSVGDIECPENAQASGIMTIPARCVLSTERLTEMAEERRPRARAPRAPRRCRPTSSSRPRKTASRPALEAWDQAGR